jgi:glycosyltransferase involved in cell wall biosynthesis
MKCLEVSTIYKKPTVLIVSSKWPDSDRSGVSLTAKKHVEILSQNGYVIHILGILQNYVANVRCETSEYILAKGSGSLYSPARVDFQNLKKSVLRVAPDFVLVEAWQSAICEAAIKVAYELQIPVAMISHGLSITAFSDQWIDRLRAMAWCRYAKRTLPATIQMLDAITTLDLQSGSDRFQDRNLASRQGIPIFELTNSAINRSTKFYSYSERENYIVNVGYFSRVKNQLELIRIFALLPLEVSLHLIGRRKGWYFQRCKALVERLKLSERVNFIEDNECDVGEEIAKAKLYVSTSITEALPVTILEAMFAGTPFVSYDVGAVSALDAGGVISKRCDIIPNISHLISSKNKWTNLSDHARHLASKRYSDDAVEGQLLNLAKFMMTKAFSISELRNLPTDLHK